MTYTAVGGAINPSYRQTTDRSYGAGRLKGRPGVSKQDVCERRAKPTAPVAEYAPFMGKGIT